MAAFPRAYRSSATHRNGGTAGHRRATPSQTTGRTYSDVGTGIHNAKVEGIKEGGELPRLCNFIAESAIRFLSKLSCRWRRSYRAAHQAYEHCRKVAHQEPDHHRGRQAEDARVLLCAAGRGERRYGGQTGSGRRHLGDGDRADLRQRPECRRRRQKSRLREAERRQLEL